MASWDTPVVNAPTTANYAPPVQDFSGFANLLTDFVKGRQEGRDEDKARAFRNGIPRDSSGEPDFNKITDTAARVGGIDYAMPLLNLQVQREAGAGNAAAVSQAQGVATGQGSPPSAVPSGAPSVPQQPIAPRSAAPASVAGPQQGDAAGSIVGLVQGSMPDELAGPVIGQLSASLRIDPNAPLNEAQTKAVRAYLARQGQGQQAAAQPVTPQGSPAPAPTSPPAPSIADRSSPLGPISSGDMQTADRLDLAAAGLRQRAAGTANLNPKGADALIKQADAYSDRAKQIREQVSTANQPPPSIKEWRQSGSSLPYDEWIAGAEGSKETAKEDAKAYATKYATIIDNGTKAQQEIPQLELMQQEMKDPNFFSGAGEKYNLIYKRLKSAVGIDPEAPVPQEMLRKITSANILGSLGALKGLGQIRVAEINLAKDAAASPDNSVPANQFLVETSKRTHQRNAEIADMAQDYKDQNGALDAGFDKKVTAFYKEHPLFNDAEIKDWHKIIGAPAKQQASAPSTAQPAQVPTFGSPAEVRAANLPSGTKFKDANGVVRMVP